MLTVFNRQELIITMDMKRQAEIREILARNKIKYTVKSTNLQSPGFFNSDRTRGVFGINQNCSIEYKIYVHRKDYDKAKWLIHQA